MLHLDFMCCFIFNGCFGVINDGWMDRKLQIQLFTVEFRQVVIRNVVSAYSVS